MAELARARGAVLLAFAVNGLCFASWLSRAPAVRDGLSLSSARLGLLLLCLSVGSCAALPLAGPLVHRFGAARVVLLGSLVAGVGMLGLAVGLLTATVWPAAVGLALSGTGMGSWDVAMNVAGTEVERRLGRPLMPKLHAAFSVGTVGGAGTGAAAAAIGIPLAPQVAVAGILAPLSMVVAVRRFRPAITAPTEGTHRRWGGLDAWREPRTLLVGLLTLAFAFTEGTANDWLAVALVDGHHADEALGAIGFGGFVTAMTIGRLCGGAVLERVDRVTVLRGAVLLAMAGLLLVTVVNAMPLVLAGTLLWGLGTALGFPVSMSAVGEDPARAAGRVSVVSSIGYTAFLAGPPLVGFLAEHNGILRALLVVLGALVIAGLTASATRSIPIATTTAHPADDRLDEVIEGGKR